jgi:hypothetical protein
MTQIILDFITENQLFCIVLMFAFRPVRVNIEKKGE